MDQTDFRLTYVQKTGSAVAEVFDDLAQLRIQIFRDFPYLYEGSIEYERTYLHTYAQSARSFLWAVYDGRQMVGATTCIPLEDETTDVKNPFEKAGWNVSDIFYFGESLLLPAYRGQGIGHLFFDERERHAASFDGITHTCFCAVHRAEDHPQRPADYRPLDDFWQKRGYQKSPELVATFDWPDIGDNESTAKPMIYWMRPLPDRL